jgi:hypothetical protein
MGVVELDVVEGPVGRAGGAVRPVEAEPARAARYTRVGQEIGSVMHGTTFARRYDISVTPP